MIRLEYKWPQPPDHGPGDYYADQPTRRNAEAQANALEGGSLAAWDDIQIGEARTAKMAKEPAGYLCEENPLPGV